MYYQLGFLRSTCLRSSIHSRTFIARLPRSHQCLHSCCRHLLILDHISRNFLQTHECCALDLGIRPTEQHSLRLLAKIERCPFVVMKRPIYANSLCLLYSTEKGRVLLTLEKFLR